MFASRWFMTLFSRDFPADVVVRIWDCFFMEGLKIMFRVALAVLKLVQSKIKYNFSILKAKQ